MPSAGIEYYLPLFFEKTALITDYLPPDTADRARSGALAAGDRAVLERHHRALLDAARRPRQPAAAAARSLPDHRRVLRRHQAVLPRRDSGRGRTADRRPIDSITSVTSHAVAATSLAAAAARRRTARRRTRCTACARSSMRSRDGRWCWRKGWAGARRCRSISPSTGCSLSLAQGFREFRRRHASRLMLGVGPLHAGFVLAEAHARDRHRERALRAAGAAAPRARRRAARLARRHAARPVGGQDRRPGRARAARHRPLPSGSSP